MPGENHLKLQQIARERLIKEGFDPDKISFTEKKTLRDLTRWELNFYEASDKREPTRCYMAISGSGTFVEFNNVYILIQENYVPKSEIQDKIDELDNYKPPEGLHLIQAMEGITTRSAIKKALQSLITPSCNCDSEQCTHTKAECKDKVGDEG